MATVRLPSVPVPRYSPFSGLKVDSAAFFSSSGVSAMPKGSLLAVFPCVMAGIGAVLSSSADIGRGSVSGMSVPSISFPYSSSARMIWTRGEHEVASARDGIKMIKRIVPSKRTIFWCFCALVWMRWDWTFWPCVRMRMDGLRCWMDGEWGWAYMFARLDSWFSRLFLPPAEDRELWLGGFEI